MNKSFDLQQIKIYIDTKIPGIKEPLTLTKSMIYIVKDNIINDHIIEEGNGNSNENDYPYFNNYHKYPKNELERKSYKDRLKFFFDKEIFINTLRNTQTDLSIDIAQYNINTMIELLFTTVYPIVNDNTTSYERYIQGHMNNNLSLKGSIPNSLKFLNYFAPSLNIDFTYLKIQNKTYTVTSTCILNDIINHPKYNDLNTRFIEFEKWRQYTIPKINDTLEKLKQKTVLRIKKISNINLILQEINGKFLLRQKENYLKKKNFSKSLLTHFEFFLSISKRNKDVIDSLKTIDDTISKSDVFDNDGYGSSKFSDVKYLINEILTLNIVKNVYFSDNVKEEASTSEAKIYLDRNFQKYNQLLDEIKKFSSPNRISSNKILQNMIDDYISNKNLLLGQYFKYVNNMKNKNYTAFPNAVHNIYKFDHAISSLNVGVNSYDFNSSTDTKPMFEAYVAFNLIGGELNSTNINKISCKYRNNHIGSLYNNLNKKKKIEIDKMYIDLDDMLNKNDSKLKSHNNDKNNTKKGGRFKTFKTKTKKKKHFF